MLDINKMANAEILLSHAKFYQRPRSFKNILENGQRVELLNVLSWLSFVHGQENIFRQWALAALCKSEAQRKQYANLCIFSRLQCWRLWSVIFSEWDGSASIHGHRPAREILHEAFTLLNDRADDTKDDTLHALIKAYASNSRDNRVSKLRRAQHIFLGSESLAPYIKVFEKNLGVPLKMYVNVIYYLIDYWHNVGSSRQSPPSINEWAISAEWLSNRTNTSVDQIKSILKEISFSADQGRAFAESTIDQPNEFLLYRETPLFEISDGRYVPVEGKLLEELLFENLLYRIHKANGEEREFLSLFGLEFEKYAQEYAFIFMKNLPQYEVIEEFVFGDKKNKILSPDVIISVPGKSALAVFEMKSARPLYNSLSTENNQEAVDKSVDKLYVTPLKQAFKAVQNILKHEAHPSFSVDSRYTIVSVTMNNYPMNFMEFNVEDGHGNNLAPGLHSFDIETFEVLMHASRYPGQHNILDMLLECYRRRYEMSAKTVIKRLIDQMYKQGLRTDNVYNKIQNEALERHRSYFQGFAM
ncbi:hypothetical protein ACOI7N_23590 [Pseudomonas sp. P2758]|uniref:hypothetical protein n=1 Tax=Pseudomonas sp. P2758 TaxID=3409916 RepID=UPI003B58C076